MTVLIIVLAAWVVVAALIVVFVGGAALDRPDIHDGAQMRQQRADRSLHRLWGRPCGLRESRHPHVFDVRVHRLHRRLLV